MATQTALLLTEIGQPLVKGSLPIPEPQESELLIKITAAGLAPLDEKLRDKNAFNIGSRLPAVLSAGIADTEAALYPINTLTSAIALFTNQGLGIPFPGTPESKSFDYASTKLAIIGGGSNTGKLAIQLARIAGVGTIITTASLTSAEELKSLGATHIIARQATDIEQHVRAIVGDDLLYIYETINEDLKLGVSLLSNSKKGTIAHLVGPGPSESLTAQKKFEAKRIAGFSHAIPEFGQMIWKQLPIWLKNGDIKPTSYRIIEGLDVDKVNAALDEYRDGKGGARYHVRV
ncbi:NAD-dependent alcohol dehydrogenase [Hyphodiscus hymeniophilus]|uniref:NAD-dependent alcohol dehydrogenase n=1 Tax=Hyphodiscus hymeniophilus TaxID=353542 RepID=A0A9P6VLY7_9HELO|nr:NAD-dependent alcohol dehydrogenase [Hyphodiscus hymeniophilus]